MLVVCNGMIRSGSTLQYNLARRIVELAGAGAGEGYFAQHDLDAGVDLLTRWSEEHHFHVIKTHVPLRRFPPRVKVDRVLFCYRDVRDIASSAKNLFNHDLPGIISALDDALEAHQDAIVAQRALIQVYESHLADVLGAANEIAQFLELGLSSVSMHEVVAENTLQAAEISSRGKRGPRYGRAILWLARALQIRKFLNWIGLSQNLIRRMKQLSDPRLSDNLLHRDHISRWRGASGYWRYSLTKVESRILTERYESWLKEHGYSID